jgi:very-short-patch-repair endonuclease
LDGDSHAGREEYDLARQAWLTSRGYRVVRFMETEVAGDLQAVLASIWEALDG